jgi:CubicO group peptidase (beta-lactamase class C family)
MHLLLLALLPATLTAQARDTSLSRATAYIEEAAREEMRSEGVPGLSFAIVANGKIVAMKGLGVAELAGGVPVTPDTRFQAGSISKVFTAIALLQMVEEGRLDPQKPVTTYLPWFKTRGNAPITLHHLLTHTAGLPRDRSDLPSSPYTAVALKDRPVGPVGDRFAYSNIGYQLLSLVMEEVAGRPFGEIVDEGVIRPLGMKHTLPAVTQEERLTSATGYQYLFDDRPPVPGVPLVPVPWSEYSAGDANIVSSASDLGLFLAAILAQGQTDGGVRLLQPVSFSRMVQRTTHALDLAPDGFYGYGIVLSTLLGDPIVWHSGGMPGFRSILMGDLDERVGIVVMMNGPGNPRRLAEYALRVLIEARRDRPLSPVIVAPPADSIPDAAQYAGRFTAPDGDSIVLTAQGARLTAEAGHGPMPLYRLGPDLFGTPDSSASRFPFRFRRAGDRVIELTHGGEWYQAGTARPRQVDNPPAWNAYVGHYRAQVPYYSNYRVVVRKGLLFLVAPEGTEEPLFVTGHNRFRVGADPRSVEEIEFEDIISGRALRLNLSGTDYYRTSD